MDQGTRFCSQCGSPAAEEDLARFGSQLVCSACKATYAQKLREGVSPVADLQYAGFWMRLLALILDGIILLIARAVVVQLAVALPVIGGAASGALALLFNLTLGAAYEVFMIGQTGATLGKMALGIKVVRPDGSPVGMGLSAGRYLAKILSGLILLIGYIIAAFDDQHRALHDRICETRVIKVR